MQKGRLREATLNIKKDPFGAASRLPKGVLTHFKKCLYHLAAAFVLGQSFQREPLLIVVRFQKRLVQLLVFAQKAFKYFLFSACQLTHSLLAIRLGAKG